MSDPTNNRTDNDTRRITVSWWLADAASWSMTWTFVGAAWGAFNPFPVPNSKQALALALARTEGRKFVPLPPFSSLASVGYYAGIAGSMATVQRFASGGVAVARNRQDGWSEFAGMGAVYAYASALFKSERRLSWNNRAFAGLVMGSIVYANTAP